MRRSGWLVTLGTGVLTLAACNFEAHKSGTGEAVKVAPNFRAISQAILEPRCAECHRGAAVATRNSKIDLWDFDALLRLGEIVPGDPKGSRIYTMVESDAMPTGPNKLTAVEKRSIFDWISQGASREGAGK